QDLLEVPLISRSAEEQNAIIRQGKPETSCECVDEQKRRFLSLKLVQYEWLVVGLDPSKIFCWPCVLSHQGEAKWIYNGIATSDLTSDVIYAHQDCDLHHRSTKWLTMKRKKLGEKSSNLTGKMVYD